MKTDPGNLDLKRLFGVQLFLLANSGWRARLRLVLRALASALVKRPLPPPSGRGVLFLNSYGRADYVLLHRRAFDACRQAKIDWQLRTAWGLNYAAFSLFLTELPHWRTVTAAAGARFLDRLFLYLFWVRCRQIGDLAERLSYTALVVVCDIQLFESYLVQLANRACVPTVTLQHGLYIDDGPALQPGNLNPANYLNISANYLLAWGAHTKALIERYSRCACIVVGNPTIPEVNRTRGTDYFYVLTDADKRFRKYNERLLEIAAEVSLRKNLRYFVQFHPDNDPKSYGDHPRGDETVPLTNAAFAIGHMTSQIFKTMRQGVPVYRLASTLAFHPVPRELLFSNADELLAKSANAEVVRRTSESYIAHIGEDSMARYADAVDLIVSGRQARGRPILGNDEIRREISAPLPSAYTDEP